MNIDNSNSAYINSTHVFIDSKKYFRMKNQKTFFLKTISNIFFNTGSY